VKRLMLLCGLRYAVPVIMAAHEMNIYVITCDNKPDNFAHRYSDEYCNASVIDKDAILNAAIRLRIDGIMSFACDPGVLTAAYVAELLHLPSCGPYESVAILQNKGKFRRFLAANGFNVPTAKSYTSVDDAIGDTGLFHWPVIVKPTDSAGSKGVTKVDNPTILKKSIEHALSFSISKEFIIEDFLMQEGFASDTDCFSINGELVFVSFNAQHFDKNAINPFTPSAYTWPSSISAANESVLISEIQRVLTLLKMGTSIYNIESRVCIDGKAYIMECSPRGGGNRLAECIKYATGVDLVSNSVRAAVGLPIEVIEQKPYRGWWAEIILHSSKPGVYESLWINDDIKRYIIEVDIWITCGSNVGGFCGANEAIGTIILNFPDYHIQKEVMDNISRYVSVVIKENT